MKMNKKGFTKIMVVMVLFVLVALVPLSLWTNRNLDFWVSYFKGHAVHIPFFLAFVLTIVGNGVSIFANLLAEIGRYFI